MIRFPSQTRFGYSLLNRLSELLLFGSLATSAISADHAGGNEEAVNEAKNLARMNCGAQIECIMPDGHRAAIASRTSSEAGPTALIMDDDTISCPLQGGETTFVIALPKAALLDRFTFVNENAAARGELKIAVSNYRLPVSSSKWTEVEGVIPFARKRLFNLSMLGIEAKYVKLSFHVENEARIAALGLYGEESLEKFAEKQGRIVQVKNSTRAFNLEDVVNFNFANLYARAHVVFVSSGSPFAATRMIDDDTVTSFRFSKTDPHPTVIVELADREQLHRVSALYKIQAGRLDVYLTDGLPQDPNNLDNLTPIATVTDPGNGKAAVNFNSQGARYVALRWTPDTAHRHNDDFELAEIKAFGNVPLSILHTTEVPLYASNLAAKPAPGEGGPDFSNKLGTLADPPVIPVVSP
jgi:hypothetical protein